MYKVETDQQAVTEPITERPRDPSLGDLMPPDHAGAATAESEERTAADFLEFYGLKTNPFPDSVNPSFFYRTERHDETLIRLLFAAERDLSLAMVTGPSGTGKTLLSQMVLTRLDPAKFQVALVLVSPGMGKTALLREVLSELAVPLPEGPFVSTRDLLQLLSDKIIDLYKSNRKLVVLIDECHFLSADSLHMVRTISNIEIPERKLTTCILFAESRFLKRLENPSYDSLRNRMYMRGELVPLSAADCEQYVKFRLLVSGRMEDLFDGGALASLHAHAGGICRNINKLAMLSLLEGFIRRAPLITAGVVEHAAATQ